MTNVFSLENTGILSTYRNQFLIAAKRLGRLFGVGKFLGATALATGGVFFHCLGELLVLEGDWRGSDLWMNVTAGLTGGTISIIALLDARSRYQEYKKAKDLFFENGFKTRIPDMFIHSKCQRDAVRIAAADLGLGDRLERYYRKKGYRWFHILPDFTFTRPCLFFTRRYWEKTLFVPGYRSRYFLW